MKELIDRNELVDELVQMIPEEFETPPDHPEWQIEISAVRRILDEVITRIEDYPFYDIVECKDCKYAQMSYRGDVKYCSIWFPNKPHCMPKDHFCSMGERKEK